MSTRDRDEPGGGGSLASVSSDWLRGFRAYFAVTILANLVWETLQLPLYTIWSTGTAREISFAVIHCIGGDVLIALTVLVFALIGVGSRDWPAGRYWPVMLVAVALGVSYTIFSEWLNIVVRANWAYSNLMPVVPVIRTGLSPLLQWIIIPAAALQLARRAALKH